MLTAGTIANSIALLANAVTSAYDQFVVGADE